LKNDAGIDQKSPKIKYNQAKQGEIMLNLTIITVGNLKEDYLKKAVAEYQKRLGAYCKPSIVELKEVKLSDSPSKVEIESALAAESEKILSSIPPRAFKVALCVEGKQMSSEKLAETIEKASLTHSELCFIIGSSYGLSPAVKSAADLRLSFSELTFPHQLMRVICAEAVYRAFTIIKGTKYHK
jgi:23S rRNA (pseudouridine1915-N3)-methyltransferase